MLHLGTGGGITWGSDPEGEWIETELKARRLLEVASGMYAGAAVSTAGSTIHDRG
jgi:para-aminobenzoate synthetase component 1